MHVSQSTRQAALFGLYQSECRDIVVMFMEDIKDAWSSTGLRQADCKIAIDEMLDNDYIRTYSSASGILAYLTADGLKELDRSTVPAMRRLIDWITLQRAQWRRRHPSSAQRRLRRRRIDDLAERS